MPGLIRARRSPPLPRTDDQRVPGGGKAVEIILRGRVAHAQFAARKPLPRVANRRFPSAASIPAEPISRVVAQTATGSREL